MNPKDREALPCCANCRFSHGARCRRHPPTIVGEVITLVTNHEWARDEGTEPGRFYLYLRQAVDDATMWPVIHDDDWCGEHQRDDPIVS